MEWLISLATGVVTEIGKLLVEKIVPQCQHVIHPDRSINNLREAHGQLRGMKKALEGRVNADRDNGLQITHEVENWLREVRGIEAELQQLFEEVVNEKYQWRRHSLSRRAAKRGDEVSSLIESHRNLQIISYPASRLRVGETFTDYVMVFQSRTEIIMEVIKKLRSDEFKRISICGMGGVGKTTLVKEVIKKAEADKLFDEVAFIVVSQDVDYWKVQDNIAGTLGLTLKKETLEVRAGQILNRLKSINKILIVLDDVWTEIDFGCIGLPSSIEYQRGCKILFTSRDEQVCHKMSSQKNFTVRNLSSDDAWNLFREMAGSDICNQYDIHSTAKEITDKCKGLPIAIVTVGKTLRNQENHAWKDVLNQLKNFPATSEMVHVYSLIQLSYNFLGSEHRDCLLLCCLFPEDFDIPIEVLMRNGLGLGLFEGVGELQDVRNRVHRLVGDLKNLFLLLDSVIVECVKMHDVVREAVIWIASQEQHRTKRGVVEIRRPKEGACDYKAISLTLNELKQLPVALDYSNYQLLQVASRNEESIRWPEDLFQVMSKLKVLSMQNSCIPEMSSVFRALHNLRTLRLENCEVGDVSIIGEELTKLEILSFAGSNIKQLPLEIGRLGSLKLLDLTECNNLYKIHSNVLASLCQLEELYIDEFPWQQNKTILAELELLSHQLKVLEIKVRKFEILPTDVEFKNLEKFWVHMEPFRTTRRVGYQYPSILEIRAADCDSINSNMLMRGLMKKCEILHLSSVKNLKHLTSIHGIDLDGRFSVLTVKKCDGLEFLIPKESMVEFSNLVELKLSHLPNLLGFAKAEADTSMKVEELKDSEIVEDGLPSSGGKLFICDWMQRFPKLQKIVLTRCSSLGMVFDLQEYSNLVGQTNALLFPQMKEMEIDELSTLTYVWGNVPHNVQGFENLRSLKISGCHSLRYVFTPSIVRALKHLERVEIRNCQLMKELVSTGIESNCVDDEKEEKEETVVFAKLVYLYLYGLPKLVSFCSDSHIEFAWPSMKALSIILCGLHHIEIQKIIASTKQDNPVVFSNIDSSTTPSTKGSTMKIFNCCFGYANKTNNKASSSKDHIPSIDEMEMNLSSPMPILQRIDIRDCNSMDVIFKHSKRMNVDSFSGVQSLGLSGMPNLESFCHRISDSPSLDDYDDNNNNVGTFNEVGTRIRHVSFIDGFLLPNLTFLQVWNCDKINSLFSLSSSKSLECLKNLEIGYCDNVEEIVLGEKETKPSEIVFPGLRLLRLEHLGNFRSFCSSPHHLEFPSLEEVSISDCRDMEEISCGSSNAPKLQDVTIAGPHYEIKIMHKRDLNAIVQQYKALNVAPQTSEALRWSELDQGVLSCFIKNHEKILRVILFDEIHMFLHLKKLYVSNCTSLVEVFESEGILDLDLKKKDYELEEMELENLPKLMHIWKSLISEVLSFTNLRKLKISECHNLNSVLPLSVAQSLVRLEHLSVQNCKMIEEIVIQNDEEVEEVNNKVKITYPELKELYLCQLPILRSFCSGAYGFDLQSCKKMVIEKCPNITTFSHGTVSTPKLRGIIILIVDYFSYELEMRTMGDLNFTIHCIQNAGVFEEQMQKSKTLEWIEHDEHLLGYVTRVTELNLTGYESLSVCVPSNMMHRFQHLDRLDVKECVSIVEIFESEGVSANNKEDGIMQYEMKSMYLHSLPKLLSIWKSLHAWILGFHNLSKLVVESCHSLKSVFPLSIAKSLPRLGCLIVNDCQKMEEIIAFKTDEDDNKSQEPTETKVLIFPKLWTLILEDLPSLNRFCPGPCDLELPSCGKIIIRNSKKMGSFCDGITFTPRISSVFVEGREYDSEEGLDAIIQCQYQSQNASKIEN